MSAERRTQSKLQRPEFSARTERWIALMVDDGVGWREAALQAGVKVATARLLLSNLRVVQSMARRAAELRTGEARRNVAAVVKMRDAAFDEASTAAAKRVAMDAVRWLEGEVGPGGTTVNVGVSIQNQVVGYVMDLTESAEDERPVIDATSVLVEPEAPVHRRPPEERSFFESTAEPFERRPLIESGSVASGFGDLRERGRGPRGFGPSRRV